MFYIGIDLGQKGGIAVMVVLVPHLMNGARLFDLCSVKEESDKNDL